MLVQTMFLAAVGLVVLVVVVRANSRDDDDGAAEVVVLLRETKAARSRENGSARPSVARNSTATAATRSDGRNMVDVCL